MNNIKQKFSSVLFFTSIILFILAFNFSDNPVGNWYQQFLPSPSGGSVRDITFIDSSLGFTVSDSSILKTTNGGDNWTIKVTGYYLFERVQFLNANTGFVCGGNNTLLKTINAGENWSSITLPSIFPYDMSVYNQDTIWLVNTNGLTGGVFRTTNGGTSWQNQLNIGSQNPDHVYFFNRNIGFISNDNTYIRKTMDGGQNWTVTSGAEGFRGMYFIDSLTGWKNYGTIKKTSDGGFTWILQPMPSGPDFLSSAILDFSNINRDTIWGVGGGILLSGNRIRGVLYRTTNGGDNWLYQTPDTAIAIGQYWFVNFVNRLNGWANPPGVTEIHTTTGGDPIWYTPVRQISTKIPKGIFIRTELSQPVQSNYKF